MMLLAMAHYATAQPFAMGCNPTFDDYNPFGIGKTRDTAANRVRHSTGNVEEPKRSSQVGNVIS